MDKTNPLAIFMAGEYSTKKAIELLYPSAAEGEPLTEDERNELLTDTEQEDPHFIIQSIKWELVEDGINQRLGAEGNRFKAWK